MSVNERKANDGQLHYTTALVHGGACRKDKTCGFNVGEVRGRTAEGGAWSSDLHAACRTHDDTPQDGKQQRDHVASARNPKYALRPDAHGGLRCAANTVHG